MGINRWEQRALNLSPLTKIGMAGRLAWLGSTFMAKSPATPLFFYLCSARLSTFASSSVVSAHIAHVSAGLKRSQQQNGIFGWQRVNQKRGQNLEKARYDWRALEFEAFCHSFAKLWISLSKVLDHPFLNRLLCVTQRIHDVINQVVLIHFA